MESKLIINLKKLIGDESNVAFSRKCGLSEGSIRKILSGGAPNLVTLNKIARACNVRMSWLVDDSPIDFSNKEDEVEFEYTQEPVKPLVTSTGVNSGHAANQHMMMVKSPAKADTSVSNWFLSNCFKACLTHYGAEFNALNVLDQMGYATNLYNKLHLMADVLNVPRNRLNDLSEDVLVDQIKFLVALNLMPGCIIPTVDLYNL